MADDPVTFRRSDAKRIDIATRHVERMVKGGDTGGLGSGGAAIALRYARASGAITARSSGTLGTGTANLVSRNGATLTEDTSRSVTVSNLFDGAIDDDAWLVIGWVMGGWEVLKVGGCGDLP